MGSEKEWRTLDRRMSPRNSWTERSQGFQCSISADTFCEKTEGWRDRYVTWKDCSC
uniref:Uncharacterized protein n=1 Tax=Rhizophora mucronata TaxID=61149 RepID=A0A2P2QXV5_RHIMU